MRSPPSKPALPWWSAPPASPPPTMPRSTRRHGQRRRRVRRWQLLDHRDADGQVRADRREVCARCRGDRLCLGRQARHALGLRRANWPSGSPPFVSGDVEADRRNSAVSARRAAAPSARCRSTRSACPAYVLSCEAQFGAPSERLTIRHDAGADAAPYVAVRCSPCGTCATK